VAIDGIVYTDDTPFWLGKVTLNSECHIVYGTVLRYPISDCRRKEGRGPRNMGPRGKTSVVLY